MVPSKSTQAPIEQLAASCWKMGPCTPSRTAAHCERACSTVARQAAVQSSASQAARYARSRLISTQGWSIFLEGAAYFSSGR